MKTFENETKPLTAKKLADIQRLYGLNAYGFDRPPKLLFNWSRLFQSVVSQAGSWVCAKKYHTKQCAISKTEGGCYIEGGGDLVLSGHSVYWDYGPRKDDKANQLAKLITAIVVNWDPMRPSDSMLEEAACAALITDHAQFEEAIRDSSNGGVFGGNALADFFDWNPFSHPPIDEEYTRFCRVDVLKQDPAIVDLDLADKRLGRELLDKMQEKVSEARKRTGRYMPGPMCCSPSRDSEGALWFWVNTGTGTKIDGWLTREQIENFLKSDGAIDQLYRYQLYRY